MVMKTDRDLDCYWVDLTLKAAPLCLTREAIVSPSPKVGAHVLMGSTCVVRGGGVGPHEPLLFCVGDQVGTLDKLNTSSLYFNGN